MRRKAWGLIAIALGLYAILRFHFGPLAQDPAYHVLADTRTADRSRALVTS
jgi:hypothetical protein